MKIVAFILLVFSQSILAYPASELKLVGKGEMNWLFWKVYDIQLLNTDGKYVEQKYPLALVIRYARDIEAEDLVSSTISEWKRQSIEWIPDWETQLINMWPNVTSGDEIALHVDENRKAHFYYNQQSIGVIDDQKFAPAFLAIWLSNDTLKPDLTQQLKGASDA